jgi:hypothetical protein
MYANLSVSTLANSAAQTVVAAERARFDDTYAAIVEYLKRDKNTFVSGDEGLKLWLRANCVECAAGDDLDRLTNSSITDSRVYQLYSTDAAKCSRAIADIIHSRVSQEMGLHINASLNPVAVPPMYSIYVDTRRVANIRQLTTPSNGNNVSITKHTDIDGISVAPEELITIDLFRMLTNPMLVDHWIRVLDIERIMRPYTMARYERLIERPGIDPHIDPQTHLAILNAVASVFSTGGSLVGAAVGLNALKETPLALARLQIIACAPINDIREVIVNVATKVSKFYTVSSSITSPHIPGEAYLNRLTISYRHKNTNVSVVDIYNSGEYELIQVERSTTDGEVSGGRGKRHNRGDNRGDNRKVKELWAVPDSVRRASPATIARFAVIDLWVLSFLRDLPNMNPACLANPSATRIGIYDEISSLLDKRLVSSHKCEYIGNQLRESQMNRKRKSFTAAYYPAIRRDR